VADFYETPTLRHLSLYFWSFLKSISRSVVQTFEVLTLEVSFIVGSWNLVCWISLKMCIMFGVSLYSTTPPFVIFWRACRMFAWHSARPDVPVLSTCLQVVWVIMILFLILMVVVARTTTRLCTYRSCFLFRRFEIQILAERSFIMTEIFHGFPHSLYANSERLIQLLIFGKLSIDPFFN
jgi:hypothetical protein